MSTDGSYLGHSGEAVPRPPAGPPTPPMPRRAPEVGEQVAPLVRWLREPRPVAEPGVWRHGYEARPAEESEPIGDRQLLGGALLALLVSLLVWSLCWNGYLPVISWMLDSMPRAWFQQTESAPRAVLATYLPYALVAALVFGTAGRYGRWPRVWRRYAPAGWQRRARVLTEPLGRLKPYRRALIALLGGVLVGLMCASGAWTFWLSPGWALTPDDWHSMKPLGGLIFFNVYYLLSGLALLALTAWAGGWRELWKRRAKARDAAQRPWTPMPDRAPSVELERWPEVRAAGYPEVADLLASELRDGRASDLDYVRIEREWRTVRSRPAELPGFAQEVLTRGSAAYTHPSGARDLGVRTATHDLLTGQVRIGTALDEQRNPYHYRGRTLGLDPALLGTSLLAVGPPGSGKTGRIVRPTVEALCLQALSRQAAVVAVGTPRAALGPDDAFDVVVRVADPRSTHDLDLYAGLTDPDEAAGLLAEALVGSELGDTREATIALAQLLGPYQAAHGRFPTVRELRELLDGSPVALAELREQLDVVGQFGQQRELQARERAAGRPGDVGQLLADRVALLTRPAFDGFFGSGGTDGSRGGPLPFSLRALQHPLRVRIDLPERGHAEASRILTRLMLAQFTASVTTREDRSLFACLVLDDATHAITPDSVRGLRQLRAANAGAVLTLRTLDDVPKRLRPTLVGTVGCKVALSGVTTWDAEVFAEAWGEDWVKTEDITHNPDFSGGLLKRGLRGVRTLFTGVRATTTSVTVRDVQRKRWSASDLAHKVPHGCGVLSLTSVRGDVTPPVVLRLGTSTGAPQQGR